MVGKSRSLWDAQHLTYRKIIRIICRGLCVEEVYCKKTLLVTIHRFVSSYVCNDVLQILCFAIIVFVVPFFSHQTWWYLPSTLYASPWFYWAIVASLNPTEKVWMPKTKVYRTCHLVVYYSSKLQTNADTELDTLVTLSPSTPLPLLRGKRPRHMVQEKEMTSKNHLRVISVGPRNLK